MLTPETIAGGFIVNPGEKLEIFRGHLMSRDTQLLAKFTLSCTTDSLGRCLKIGTSFAGDPKRVRATSIGPHSCKVVSCCSERQENSGQKTHQGT